MGLARFAMIAKIGPASLRTRNLIAWIIIAMRGRHYLWSRDSVCHERANLLRIWNSVCHERATSFLHHGWCVLGVGNTICGHWIVCARSEKHHLLTMFNVFHERATLPVHHGWQLPWGDMSVRKAGILNFMRGYDECQNACRALTCGPRLLRYTQESSRRIQRACLELVRACELSTLVVPILGSFGGVVLHITCGFQIRTRALISIYPIKGRRLWGIVMSIRRSDQLWLALTSET